MTVTRLPAGDGVHAGLAGGVAVPGAQSAGTPHAQRRLAPLTLQVSGVATETTVTLRSERCRSPTIYANPVYMRDVDL